MYLFVKEIIHGVKKQRLRRMLRRLERRKPKVQLDLFGDKVLPDTPTNRFKPGDKVYITRDCRLRLGINDYTGYYIISVNALRPDKPFGIQITGERVEEIAYHDVASIESTSYVFSTKPNIPFDVSWLESFGDKVG